MLAPKAESEGKFTLLRNLSLFLLSLLLIMKIKTNKKKITLFIRNSRGAPGWNPDTDSETGYA